MGIIPKERIAEAVEIAQNPRQLNAAILTAEAIVEKNGMTKTEILRKSGYSPAISDATTAQPFNKPSFRAILEKLLPDDKLVSRHSELIYSDNDNTALRAVELGYRVHGHLQDVNLSNGAALLGLFLGQSQPKIEQPENYTDALASVVTEDAQALDQPIDDSSSSEKPGDSTT